MTPLLQVRDLSVRYCANTGESFDAVKKVSFHIAPGETLGVMGESGCGKSSIALAVMSLLPREQAHVTGSIAFRGADVRALGEREWQKLRGASISIVHQEPEIALSPLMRVGRQVAEVVHAHRALTWKRCKDHVREMLARVGFTRVDRIYEAFPQQLSGGQRQRVVLAQALVCEPALLIADEPTAHLDLQSQNEFLDLLDGVKQRSQMSILLISHALEIHARLADRLLVMRTGRIVERGSSTDVVRKTKNSYAREILSVPVRRRERRHLPIEEKALG